MNKIFKKIWNRARGCFVAVSEVANSASQKSSNITVQGYSFLSVGKGFMHTAKVFRLSAVAACLMPILGTAATLSNLAVVDVKDNSVTNSNGVVAVQLSATLQLEKGSSVTENLGSINQASLTLGGEKSSNTTIHSGQYDRYYDYFVNHHGSSFSFGDNDRDYWSATDEQLTATHYAGGLVSSYTTLYRTWSTENKLSTTGSFRTIDLYDDPKLFNKIQTSSLGTGEVSYVINNGSVVKTNTLNIKVCF